MKTFTVGGTGWQETERVVGGEMSEKGRDGSERGRQADRQTWRDYESCTEREKRLDGERQRVSHQKLTTTLSN